MDIPSIAAAISSGKALKDIIQGLIGLKVDTEVLYRINEAQTQVSNLLSALLETQGDLFTLLNETQDLRRQIQIQEAWDKRKACYRITETHGGAVVYESVAYDYENEPKHYACPRCIEKRTVQILQVMGDRDSGLFECPDCKKTYRINPHPPRPDLPKTPGYNFS
jgi:hypothetical protein